MNTENIITGTWLPVFPGFYNTLFDDENMYEQELDYIDEHVEPEELAKAMIENLHNSNAGTKLWKDYTESIARQCVKIIETELKKLGFVESIVFEEISSPKYYNFSNDSINVTVTFTPEHLQKIRQFISEHFAQWKEYLKDRYTSRDGFISYHSNDPGAEEWFADNAVNDQHNAGALMEFLCGENGIDQETLYYGCEDQVSIDLEKYKKECIESGWYVPDTLYHRIRKYFSDRSFRFFRDHGRPVWMLDTPTQRYQFAICKSEVNNDHWIIKRYCKIFVFGRLKDEKTKNKS